MYFKSTLLYLVLFFSTTSLLSQNEEKPDFSMYGQKVSIGVSILDGFGIPVRIYQKNHVFEAGAYTTGVAFYENNEVQDILLVPMFGVAYNYFGDRFLKQKRNVKKIRANGVALRLNQVVGDYSTTIPSLSWAQETFREGRFKRSFLFELGIQYGFPHFSTYYENTTYSSVGIRLRCQWNFFLK